MKIPVLILRPIYLGPQRKSLIFSLVICISRRQTEVKYKFASFLIKKNVNFFATFGFLGYPLVPGRTLKYAFLF